MLLPLMLTISLALGDGPAAKTDPPSRAQLKTSIERSLVFLEKSGGEWRDGNNQVGMKNGKPVLVKGTQAACASCHHVPMTVWCMTEAKNLGFKVNEETLDEFRSWSLRPYLKHPTLQPFNQDKFNNAKTSLNTIYLSAPLFAAKALDEQGTEALKKFAVHLLEKQEKDGAWKSGRTGYEPPIGDETDVLTMQALLTLAEIDRRGLAGKDFADSRARALAWLKANKLGETNQALILQAQIAQRFGKPEEAKPLIKRLLAEQQPDGGWRQVKDRPSDALATGMTIELLVTTLPSPQRGKGVGGEGATPAELAAIQKGQAFLLRTQEKDGSWWVPSRDKGRKGVAIAHYGSGWATLGLLRTLECAK